MSKNKLTCENVTVARTLSRLIGLWNQCTADILAINAQLQVEIHAKERPEKVKMNAFFPKLPYMLLEYFSFCLMELHIFSSLDDCSRFDLIFTSEMQKRRNFPYLTLHVLFNCSLWCGRVNSVSALSLAGMMVVKQRKQGKQWRSVCKGLVLGALLTSCMILLYCLSAPEVQFRLPE